MTVVQQVPALKTHVPPFRRNVYIKTLCTHTHTYTHIHTSTQTRTSVPHSDTFLVPRAATRQHLLSPHIGRAGQGWRLAGATPVCLPACAVGLRSIIRASAPPPCSKPASSAPADLISYLDRENSPSEEQQKTPWAAVYTALEYIP